MNGKKKSLSASNSTRWLACQPSVLLERTMPYETQIESEYMAEGTLAHEMAELKLRYMNGETTKVEYLEAIKKVKSHEFYSSEINMHTDAYVEFVMEELNVAKAADKYAKLIIEAEINTGDYVPDSNWIADAIILSDGVCRIIDLKYGKGTYVAAEGNSQLKLYALATLETFGQEFYIDTFELTIFQPRNGTEAIRTVKTEMAAVKAWGEVIVRDAAKKAQAGAGELAAGTHCKNCRVAHKCPALSAISKKAMTEEVKTAVDFLSNEEVLDRYHALPVVAIWSAAVKKHVFNEALNGTKWDGLKMIGSNGKRKIADPVALETALEAAGYAEMEYLNVNLKGIGDISNLMSKDLFAEIVEPHIGKTDSRPKLVGDHVEGEDWIEPSAGDDFKNI